MIIAIAAALSLLAQAGSQPASETWRESVTRHGTILSVGEPANATIQIRCVRPGVVRAYLAGLYTGEGPEPRRVIISSGRARSAYRLQFGLDAEGGFSTDVPVRSAPLVAFGRNGALTFAAAGAELDGNATTPAEIQTISRFLRRCRG